MPKSDNNATPLQAVVFDFDGTLTRPGALDFAAIRREMACPPSLPILEYLDTLPAGPARERAVAILEDHEIRAARAAEPNTDAEDCVFCLKARRIRLGILTRNSLRSVRIALARFARIGPADFATIVTREDEARPKPHPDGVHLAAERLGLTAAALWVVGDYVFDIEAGQRAGSVTVFLDNGGAPRRPDPPADFTIHRLSELQALIGAHGGGGINCPQPT